MPSVIATLALAAGALGWSEPLALHGLSLDPLWEAPLAGPREPRLAAMIGVLDGAVGYETSIGIEVSLLRFGPPSLPREGLELSVLAAVFTRFDTARALVAADYRFGAPLTFARGPWQLRLGYEHSSSHLGDQYLDETKARPIRHVRDELAFALARRFGPELRAYALLAYAFHTMGAALEDRARMGFGLEWTTAIAMPLGAPFVGLDVALREDQGFEPRPTLQLGWRFAREDASAAFRAAFEYARGRSPYGQFYTREETWGAFLVAYDW